MKINSHKDLWIFQEAYALSLEVNQLAGELPKEELYRLTDQAIRSSRAAPALIAEGWRKRFYPQVLKCKLVEAEGEMAETQVWLAYMRDLGFVAAEIIHELDRRYDVLLFATVKARLTPQLWSIGTENKTK